MTTIDALVVGAMSMACIGTMAAVTVVCVGKARKSFSEFCTLVRGETKEMKSLAVIVEGVRQELAYMRNLSQLSSQMAVGGEPSHIPAETTTRPPFVPFPSPVFDRFPVAPPPPDATVDDTDREGLTQTDEELAQMEIIETLRQRGIEVEDSDTVHEGIEAESE